MRRLAFLCGGVMLAASVQAAPAELSLLGYQRPDGAITVYLNGDTVDPYFAAKALLSARDARLDSSRATAAWIRWALPFQRPDGGFDRFCRKGELFAPCAPADADDAMAAVWIELLARSAPRSGLPRQWKASLAKAYQLLADLRDPASGVYYISGSVPVSLLMDNVEIYSAFEAMRAFHTRRGELRKARVWASRAKDLSQSILRTFWDLAHEFRVSTQNRSDHGFYPDHVAQLFPILGGLRLATPSASSRYALWMKENRALWLRQGENDFPWGLIALAADKMGDQDSVLCWRVRAAPFRHSVHWNVVEEAIYLAFEARFSSRATPPGCGP